jgi:hypothetical protein
MAEVLCDTQFIFYGRPRYDVADHLDNVHIKESH